MYDDQAQGNQDSFNTMQNSLNSAMYATGQEKTYYDKTLSKEEVFLLRDIVSHDIFTQEDVSMIQNILVSNEIKLTNLTDWEKYIIGKYYVWLCEYAKRFSKSLTAKKFYEKIKDQLSPRTLEARDEIDKEYSETYRLMVHVYCYLIRSPLSIDGAMLKRLTSNNQEIEYKNGMGVQSSPQAASNWR